jgi:hypothetical protein
VSLTFEGLFLKVSFWLFLRHDLATWFVLMLMFGQKGLGDYSIATFRLNPLSKDACTVIATECSSEFPATIKA